MLMGLSMAQGIALVPLYLSYLGADNYGSWLAVGSTVTLLKIGDLGLMSLASQRAAAYDGAGDFASLARFLAIMLLFSLGVAALIGLAGLGLASWLPRWIGVQEVFLPEFTAAIKISALDTMLTVLVGASGSLLFGLQKPGAHVLGMISGTLLSIAGTIFFLSHGWGIPALAAGSILLPLVALPVNLWGLIRVLRHRISWAMLRLDAVLTRDFFRAALFLGPAKTAETLIPQADNIIMIKLLGALDVTTLVLTRKVADLFVQIIARFSASFLSGLAHLVGSREEEKYRRTVFALFALAAYSGALGFGGVLLFNRDFMTLWLGPTFFGGQLVTGLLCIYGFLKVLRFTFYHAVLARNQIRVTGVASLAEAFIQLVMGLVLAGLWGIKGIVAAGIMAVTAGSLIQAVSLWRTLNLTVLLKDIGKGMKKIVWATVASMSLAYCFRLLEHQLSWFNLMLHATGYALIFITVVLIQQRKTAVYWVNYFRRDAEWNFALKQ